MESNYAKTTEAARDCEELRRLLDKSSLASQPYFPRVHMRVWLVGGAREGENTNSYPMFLKTLPRSCVYHTSGFADLAPQLVRATNYATYGTSHDCCALIRLHKFRQRETKSWP